MYFTRIRKVTATEIQFINFQLMLIVKNKINVILLLWLITKDCHNPVNQSKLKASAWGRGQYETMLNVSEGVMIGFGMMLTLPQCWLKLFPYRYLDCGHPNNHILKAWQKIGITFDSCQIWQWNDLIISQLEAIFQPFSSCPLQANFFKLAN